MVTRVKIDGGGGIDWALDVARQERVLVDFIRSRNQAGIISDEDAREIDDLREQFYKKQGIWTDDGPQDAMNNRNDLEAVVAVKRQGYYLMEIWLLALYPQLKSDVNKLRQRPNA